MIVGRCVHMPWGMSPGRTFCQRLGPRLFQRKKPASGEADGHTRRGTCQLLKGSMFRVSGDPRSCACTKCRTRRHPTLNWTSLLHEAIITLAGSAPRPSQWRWRIRPTRETCCRHSLQFLQRTLITVRSAQHPAPHPQSSCLPDRASRLPHRKAQRRPWPG